MLSESTQGSFCSLLTSVYSCHPVLDTTHLNTLRKFWEISEGMQTFQPNIEYGWRVHNFQGGKASNLDLEAEWQRVLEVLQ